VPGARLEIVALVPVPVTPPGLIVQVPDAGRPLRTTLPVGVLHDAGWVIVPTIGAVGAAGAGSMTTSAEAFEIQPGALVTVKLYVPGFRFEIVTEVPVPEILPGLIVHVPDAGSPFRTTLPIGEEQEAGWVIVPMIGAFGGVGGVLMLKLTDRSEMQPASLVTLKL